MTQSLNITKFFASVFENNHGSVESQASLKKARLMNNVHTRMQFCVVLFIFSRHYKKGNCRCI